VLFRSRGFALAPELQCPCAAMSRKDYDDIVRNTVPQTDLMMRPSKEEEQEARKGPHSLMPDEQTLETAVRGALRTELVNGVADISIEVDRDAVTLTGRVATAEEINRISDVVSRVDGVRKFNNKLVVAG